MQLVMTNKAGLATQGVARILAGCEIGEKIPTVAQLTEACDTARGNIQLALAALKESGAVEVEAHGQSGTLLKRIDYIRLAKLCGVQNIIGAMPLPYTKRYEGLATGLFTLLNDGDMRTLIAFMRGSEARVQTLLEGNSSYCVMSRLAYEDYRRRGNALQAVLDCGPQSYVGRHMLLLRPGFSGELSGCRVGIDDSSVDQSLLTKSYFAGKPVTFVSVQYTEILPMLLEGRLDAGIWNEDDLSVQNDVVQRQELELSEVEHGGTNAVVVVRKDDSLMLHLLQQYLHVGELLEIQRQVMQGTLTARY